jgi:hypothetical protein
MERTVAKTELPGQERVLAAAEALAVRTLLELSGGCEQERLLVGNTKRGPAFAYLCARCRDLTVISVPAGGLRNREPDDPTSRTRISTLPLSGVVLETGAFIESDGTIRSLLSLHLPGHEEAEWELTVERPEQVGQALRRLRELAGR